MIIPDLEASPLVAGADLDMFRELGIRSSQSTPLVSRSGKLLGMISTHWHQPHRPPKQDLHLLDVLARQAADIIERAWMQEPLRESEDRLGVLADPGPKEAQEAKDEGVG